MIPRSPSGSGAREAKAGNGLTTLERAEIRQLKAELDQVTSERDILGQSC